MNNNQVIDWNICDLVNDHEEEFKECMESYNIQNGADLLETITMAIAFNEGRYNV